MAKKVDKFQVFDTIEAGEKSYMVAQVIATGSRYEPAFIGCFPVDNTGDPLLNSVVHIGQSWERKTKAMEFPPDSYLAKYGARLARVALSQMARGKNVFEVVRQLSCENGPQTPDGGPWTIRKVYECACFPFVEKDISGRVEGALANYMAAIARSGL